MFVAPFPTFVSPIVGREEDVMFSSRSRIWIFVLTLSISALGFWGASAAPNLIQDQNQTEAVKPNLTEDEIRQFLLTAEVVRAKQTSSGITRPYRLTLSDGEITHDACFQSIDDFKSVEVLTTGTEINFRDSYHFNIATYELAKLLGLDHMMPVTVERKYKGKRGSLSWWIDNLMMDERDRLEKKIHPPDVDAWNKQMYRKWVFCQLVCDTDPNLTNLLIDNNWKIYMIDFSRAFRLHKDLRHPEEVDHCDRNLLEKLRQLDQKEVELKTKKHLQKGEIKALMKRRDKIIERIEELISQKGEDAILY
jgi:hypothetical protein